ncbi:MAG TPA: VOC family protein [Actinomycetota bacterium]
MINRIHSTFYWAEQMDAAVAFYRDALGLEMRSRVGDDWAQFEIGGSTMALHGTRGAPSPSAGATVVFEVEDLEAAMRQLGARGVAFDSEITEVPDSGRFVQLRDPAGNILQIYQPPRTGEPG